MKYIIYTDGSTKANGTKNAVGGWGYALVNGNFNSLISEDSNKVKETTNQRMELTAAINGLKVAVILLSNEEDKIIVYTDSAYLHNCYKAKWYENWEKNGWQNSKKQPVANQDLWEQLIPFFRNKQITFEKVKGHANNSTIHEVWNNHVDGLAQKAAAREEE